MKKIFVIIISAFMLITLTQPSFAADNEKKLSKPTITISVSKDGNPLIKITKTSKEATHYAVYRFNEESGKYSRIVYTIKTTYTDKKWDVKKSGDTKYRVQAVIMKDKKVINKSDASAAKSTSTKSSDTSKNNKVSQLQTVKSPPESHITCTKCNGTGKFVCAVCNDTKYVVKNGSLQVCAACFFFQPICLSCVGGKVDNPEYKDYVTELIELSNKTGEKIFFVEDNQEMPYIAISTCSTCEGTGRTSFYGIPKYCSECAGKGMVLSRYNNLEDIPQSNSSEKKEETITTQSNYPRIDPGGF